jgi:methylmalonyl-CoA/ethylmalonyl-CoA epimerase
MASLIYGQKRWKNSILEVEYVMNRNALPLLFIPVLCSILVSTASLEATAGDGENKTKTAAPMFTGISEIVMVVEDLDAAVRKQWDTFGIGPWEIWTFDTSTVKDMVTHDQPGDFSIKIAYTKIGDTYWELIQPLDTKSTYYEVLKERGEGVHNIVFETKDYDTTIAEMRNRGIGVYSGGDWQGIKFTNFDTRGVLPVIAEIFHVEEGKSFPPPEETYP